jgi:hypothetical protein
VDVITVCKPASVPVHACGQYRKNTVVGILQAEHNNIGPLFPVHRLDRLVSGLLILARNVHTANFFRQEIEGGCIQKQYVAKVKGVFPADEVEVNAAVIYDAKEGKSSVKVIVSFFFKSLILLSQVVVILISVILMSSNQMLKVQSGTELESLVSCWLQTSVPDMSGNKAFWSEPWRLEWREVQSTFAMGSL